MRRTLILFSQALIVLIGLCAVFILLWEPHLEGRNAHASLWQIYFNDPFLAYVYAVSILFFVMLYKLFRILGYMGKSKTFSQATIRALRVIQYCAFVIAGAVLMADVYIVTAARGDDDPAGAVMLGAIAICIFIAIGKVAAVFVGAVQRRMPGYASSKARQK